jgi:hypothetical protein
LVGVDDQEGPATLGEVVSDRQAGLTAPDDEGLHVLTSLAHVISSLGSMMRDSTTGIV